MLAKFKLQNPKNEVEAIVLVYHEQVEPDFELMVDFTEKYLPSIICNEMMEPKTFKELCEGKNENIFKYRKVSNCGRL